MTDWGTVLVTGATGSTGSALLDQLLPRGVDVRVMVRRDTDVPPFLVLGADVAVADFDDAAACAAALDGVRRVYLVTPSSEHAEGQQRRFADLAAAADVEHLVKLSQLGADVSSPVRFHRWHAAVEQHLRQLPLGWTFLRPNLFFQGLFAFAGMIARDGQFFAPIGDARVSAVDVRDIAAVAAAALTEPGHEGKTYTITGPAAITHAEIAEALSAATGRDVTFVDVPPDVFRAALDGALPPWQLDGLVEDYAHYARGEAAAVLPTVQELTGQEPRDVARFALDYADRFTAQAG
jgi:uncharacterized protein YbjT (DUF2867 family)